MKLIIRQLFDNDLIVNDEIMDEFQNLTVISILVRILFANKISSNKLNILFELEIKICVSPPKIELHD